MLISHECLNSIFSYVQQETDYDYFLIHLLLENKAYMNHYMQSKLSNREIILDNSIFELGEAFEPVLYADAIEQLKPTWYILPDSLENSTKTISNAVQFLEKYPTLPGKKIGVVQGKTYEDALWCYEGLLKLDIDMIAISFDYSFYTRWYNNLPKLEAWMNGRRSFLTQLSQEVCFDRKMPIHLLGCSLPQEFEAYKDFEKEINLYSLDTSNPVVCGLKGIQYTLEGLKEKPSQKLFELIDSEVSEQQVENIMFNIRQFRSFVNG